MEKTEKQKKGFLKTLFSKKAPWYMKILRTGLFVSFGVAAMPYAIDQIPGRSLTQEEIDKFKPIYKSSINYKEIKIHQSETGDFWLEKYKADGLTFYKTVIIKTRIKDYLRKNNIDPDYVLMHEIAHVWQDTTNKTLAWETAWGKLKSIFSGNQYHGIYQYSLLENKSLTDYDVEQQASIIADYYNITKGKRPLLLRDSFTTTTERDFFYKKILGDLWPDKPAHRRTFPVS